MNEMLSVVTSVGTGVGEIAWGFVPILPDLLDYGKEALWQPVINGQDANSWVVAFSAFGLLADADYIALPADAAGTAYRSLTAEVLRSVCRCDYAERE